MTEIKLRNLIIEKENKLVVKILAEGLSVNTLRNILIDLFELKDFLEKIIVVSKDNKHLGLVYIISSGLPPVPISCENMMTQGG